MDVLREILLPEARRREDVRRLVDGPLPAPTRTARQACTSPAATSSRSSSTATPGCEQDDILAGAGLTWETLCTPREERRDRRRVDAARPGRRGLRLHRREAAAAVPGAPHGRQAVHPARPGPSRKSGWRWQLGDTRRVLYRLPKVIEAIADGEVIYIAEGEKDVHALEAAGRRGDLQLGRRRQVAAGVRRVPPRRDRPHRRRQGQAGPGARPAGRGQPGGRRGGRRDRGSCRGGKDAADHLAARQGDGRLRVTTKQADDEAEPDLAPDLHEFIGIVDPPNDWVIPGILERGDRLIWTGVEGLGKTVMTRQLAVAAAAGIHPFTGEPIDPAAGPVHRLREP